MFKSFINKLVADTLYDFFHKTIKIYIRERERERQTDKQAGRQPDKQTDRKENIPSYVDEIFTG